MSQKVDRVLDEDPAYEDALAVIQQELEDDGVVEWDDVDGEITSGQWGRLIQLGVLEEADDRDGYVLYDESAVEDKVGVSPSIASPKMGSAPDTSSSSSESDEDDEEGGWSRYDLIALLVAGVFSAGYVFDPIRNTVGETLHTILGPLDAILPFFAVVGLVATVTALYTTFLQSRIMESTEMGDLKERMDSLKQRREDAKERGDDQALQRIDEQQKELMQEYPSMMKQQFRPMVWIMALTLPIFLWLLWVVSTGQIAAAEQTIILPLVGETAWTGTVGPLKTWIVWYLLISLGMSQVVQKLLGIDISPT